MQKISRHGELFPFIRREQNMPDKKQRFTEELIDLLPVFKASKVKTAMPQKFECPVAMGNIKASVCQNILLAQNDGKFLPRHRPDIFRRALVA
jgi:hypothetical protein